MWCIRDIPIQLFEAKVILDVKRFGKGLPKGFNGDQKEGFSLFELVESETEAGVSIEEEYITSRITKTPTLVAITEAQFKNWAKKKIIARPALFIYSEQRFEEVLNLKTGQA